MASSNLGRSQAGLVTVLILALPLAQALLLLPVLRPGQLLGLGAQSRNHASLAPMGPLAVTQVGDGTGLQAAGLGMALGPGPDLARHIAAVKGIGVAEQLGRQGCLEALLTLVGPGPGQECRIHRIAGRGRECHDKAPRRNRPPTFCSGCYEAGGYDIKLRARGLTGPGRVGGHHWAGRSELAGPLARIQGSQPGPKATPGRPIRWNGPSNGPVDARWQPP